MTKKFQIEISEEEFKEINALLERSGVKTKKELFFNAIAFLDWALDEKKLGRIIASVDEKEERYKEVVMPIFKRKAQTTM